MVVSVPAHPGMALVDATATATTGGSGEFAETLLGLPILSLLYWGWVTLPIGGLRGWMAGRLVCAGGTSTEGRPGLQAHTPAPRHVRAFVRGCRYD
jgi:hypothetical protein